MFGWYLRKIGSIAIIRETTTKENLNFFDKIKEKLETNKRPLLIFPQGTRVKLDEQPPFKKGVGRIYDELKINCQPVAINSGNVWPKNGNITSKKTIIISILPTVKPGMNSADFTNYIESSINVLSNENAEKKFNISFAQKKIRNLIFEPVIDEVYKVNVVKILDFGAVVEFVPGKEALLHVSEIAWERDDKVTDYINLGDQIEVKYLGIDKRTRKQKI